MDPCLREDPHLPHVLPSARVPEAPERPEPAGRAFLRQGGELDAGRRDKRSSDLLTAVSGQDCC